MASHAVYVFYFSEDGNVTRIPYARWDRIESGKETVEDYSNLTIRIAYAYLLLENKKPDYCARIEGQIYHFDQSGRIIQDNPPYFDLLQDIDEASGGVINLEHRKKKKEAFDKYYWELNSQQIQAVIDSIW
jgi:hypothetical protein